MTGHASSMPACAADNSASETAAIFHWDIGRDRLHWNDAARKALHIGPQTDISSGRALMLLLDPSHAELRHDAITEAMRHNNGHYVISYRFMPHGRGEDRGFMVVEHGRFTLDAHGKPAHVFGTIRRIDCSGKDTCSIPGLPEMDPSSGLFCRSYFFKRLERFLGDQAPQGRHAALLLLSLRNYSIIFDAYGFEAADATYAEVARRLNQVLRAGDIIARYGDNRIAMLIHDCMEDDLGPAMQRFLQAPLHDAIETEQAPIWPMLAIGAVLLPQQARTLTEAITCAEEALSEAESKPGNNAVVFSTASGKVSQRAMKARFANEIFDALRHHRFTLAFQPIVLSDGGIFCHEALLRIFNNRDEPVPAAHLVPVAEELGLIRQVDMEVLQLALQTLRNTPDGCLAINVSAMTVLSAQDFLQTLAEHAELVHNRLIIEITESAALSDAEQINTVIARLHELGCRVALDDFGAGYTSFRNLRDFHFDIVKIDGAFCENLSENTQNQHFVRSLIELARNIDIRIIAEWVENEQDARLLREWGVDALQGYLFGAAGHDGPWCIPCLEQHEQTLVLPQEPVEKRAGNHDKGKQAPEEPQAADSPSATATETANVSDAPSPAPTTPIRAAHTPQGNDIGNLMQELQSDLQKLRQLLDQMRGDGQQQPATSGTSG